MNPFQITEDPRSPHCWPILAVWAVARVAWEAAEEALVAPEVSSKALDIKKSPSFLSGDALLMAALSRFAGGRDGAAGRGMRS